MACDKIKEMLSYIIRDDMVQELRVKKCAEMEGQYEK